MAIPSLLSRLDSSNTVSRTPPVSGISLEWRRLMRGRVYGSLIDVYVIHHGEYANEVSRTML